MRILKGLGKLVVDTYGPFLPTSKAKKEAFLDKVREKVDYYKPRIEEKCQVDLGDMGVKDLKEFLPDFTAESVNKNITEHMLRTGRMPTKLERHFYWMVGSIVEDLAKIPAWIIVNFRGGEAKYYKSNIYIPFYFQNRFMDLDFQKRTECLDQTIVHELSHGLWYSLDGIEESSRDWRLWNEGFATYCADVYFLNLYPTPVKIEDGGIVHKRGKEKVEELVAKYGKNILLEIPRRWQEFNQE